ncbi:MAG: hypothetical protein DIZ78_10145 [endosymbiont of Escarpia spicata]|uniref:Phytase-like domain-containing protein n=1 Tax=endosymbiont of Escarpia spicata TaxID=2200908 RepID=A0A370DNT9_9GAMM|nr:MAG: hypothetical protein DIZ78_10145 [endosymbiont of Escarpia spicata]
MTIERFIVFLLIILTSFGCFAEEYTIRSSILNVMNERNLHELLVNKSKEKKHEASGVLFANNSFFIVFDNHSRVARIDSDLHKAELFGTATKGIGYEGISHDNVNSKFYLIEESNDNDGALNARINITNNKFSLEKKKWLKYNFQKNNKGFEGITTVVKDNNSYILALCEGNDCDAGSASKINGAGRIKVFEKKQKKWKYVASIRLPRTLEFIDYSGIDINSDNMLAITSQESSAIFVAGLDLMNWKVVDDGVVYRFPKNVNGNVVYCNIEGVAWIATDQLVTVSDAKKGYQQEQCKEKEQSIHIVSM